MVMNQKWETIRAYEATEGQPAIVESLVSLDGPIYRVRAFPHGNMLPWSYVYGLGDDSLQKADKAARLAADGTLVLTKERNYKELRGSKATRRLSSLLDKLGEEWGG